MDLVIPPESEGFLISADYSKYGFSFSMIIVKEEFLCVSLNDE
jgi:hypothetical protein